MNYIDAIGLLEKNQLHGLVIINGEEEFLVDYFIDVVKTETLASGFEDFNYEKIEFSNPKLSRIIESCETIPFGGGYRVVEVRGLDLSRDGTSKYKEFYEQLANYADQLDDSIILIIVSESGKIFKGAFYKKVSKYSIILEMSKLNRREFSGFITKQVNSKGLKVKTDILNYIIDRTGYLNSDLNKNLYDVQNELDKLTSSIKKGERIDKASVDSLLVSSVEKNIFEMTDAICMGNTTKALNSFLNLNTGKDDNYLAFYMIIRLFRNLLYIKEYKKEKLKNPDIMKKLGISSFEFGKLNGFESRINRDTLLKIYSQLYDIEVNLKSSVGDFENNMLYLISRITTELRF